MRARSLFLTLAAPALVVSTVLAAGPQRKADDNKVDNNSGGERFTALAANMGNTRAASGAGTIEINVERWSTPAETQKLTNALREDGANNLLKTLSNMPRVGSISTPASVGYDVRYASHTMQGGSEHVTLITDRPLGLWEQMNQNRSVDYPFTLVELHVGPNGKGEGKLSFATKITLNPDTNMIELENYGIQPTLLDGVQRVK